MPGVHELSDTQAAGGLNIERCRPSSLAHGMCYMCYLCHTAVYCCRAYPIEVQMIVTILSEMYGATVIPWLVAFSFAIRGPEVEARSREDGRPIEGVSDTDATRDHLAHGGGGRGRRFQRYQHVQSGADLTKARAIKWHSWSHSWDTSLHAGRKILER